MNLCPFAKPVLTKDQVRFLISHARTEEQLLMDLQDELLHLEVDRTTETTLLIHPYVLADFGDYNQFLGILDQLLAEAGLEGIVQIASFHPDYQFAGTQTDDPENYTNRSPYPMLHLLREDRITEALAHFQHPEQIPERNITLLRKLGRQKMEALLQACFNNEER